MRILLWILVFYLGMGVVNYAYAAGIERSDVILHLDDSRAYVNGSLVYIDKLNKSVVPIIKNERTLVPVRFIAEKYADEILWDKDSKKVTINSGKNQIIYR